MTVNRGGVFGVSADGGGSLFDRLGRIIGLHPERRAVNRYWKNVNREGSMAQGARRRARGAGSGVRGERAGDQ